MESRENRGGNRWEGNWKIFDYNYIKVASYCRSKKMSERKIWKPEVLPVASLGRPDSEGVVRGTAHHQVEPDLQDDGVAGHRGTQRQAMPRTIPQPPQRRHSQGEVVVGRRDPFGRPPCLTRQPLGPYIQTHPRQVLQKSLRTENCVKNMLYSKLRKAIRQLNRFSY
jgi:hypothetical protein